MKLRLKYEEKRSCFDKNRADCQQKKKRANRLDITVEKLLDLQKVGLKTKSLESNLNQDSEFSLLNIIPDEKSDGTKLLEELGNQSFFSELTRDLDQQEKDIVFSYYCSEEKISWGEIAQQHNLSTTRIGQIKRKALGKMKRRLTIS